MSTITNVEATLYKLWLPMIMGTVPEIGVTFRWYHIVGQPLSITYKWVDELENPNHTWRIAFQQGINNWNSADTLINFYYHSGSMNTIDAIFDQEEYTRGYAILIDENGDHLTDRVEVVGNLYWDIHDGYSNNQRLEVASHEIGHLQSIGHIPRTEPEALMWEYRYLSEMEYIFSPQPIDVMLVNQVNR